MTIIKKGFFLEMTNRSTQRIVFSAATDELEKETFDKLWSTIGDNVYSGVEGDVQQYYEIRVCPI